MSQEPSTPDLVELSRRRLAAVNRRDIEAVMSFFAADPVWDMSPINMGIFEGRAAIRGALETWWETFDGFVSELNEVREIGHGVLFQIVTQRGRLAGSEGEIRQHSARVFVLVDGLIERLTSFNDTDEARSVAERLADERG